MRKLVALSLLGWLMWGHPTPAAEPPTVYEKVYLTQAQALATVMPGLQVKSQTVALSAAKRKQIQARLHRKVPENQITLFVGQHQGKTERYALVMNEIGKYYPITFMVAVNPKGSVEQVVIMVYREKRGDAVRRGRFLNQFNHKSSQDALAVNTDIIHLTGATISSWSVAAGVKKALVLLEELVLHP